MDLVEGILRRASRTGQMLAFLAALFLAFNPHSLYALSVNGANHNHSGSFCDVLDTEMSSSDSENHAQGSHGDCIHHFDPLVRAPTVHRLILGPDMIAVPFLGPVRQSILTTDPPPPR